MLTFSQLIRNNRKQKPPRHRCRRFFGSPFKRGRIEKILSNVAPKKPNSAKRKIAKIKLVNGWFVRAKIPGQGYNLQKFSEVLVRGGRVRDIPGIHYIIVKGKYSFNLTERFTRMQKRSKYGLPSLRGKKYKKQLADEEKRIRETAEENAEIDKLSDEEFKKRFPIGFHRDK